MKRTIAKKNSEHGSSVYAIATEAEWDNEQLVDRALAGDPVAENALYRQHVWYLLNLAIRLTRSVADANDVVQDTFVVAFYKLDKLDSPDALRSWLTRILISQIRRSFRKRRLRSFFGLKQAREDAMLQMCAVHDVRLDLRVELRELDIILKRTPEKKRITWMLHRIEGMTLRETAQAMNRSVTTVKRYISTVDIAVQSNRRLTP
jgi:RNA polymerase sigma-70 factor (ECF subfamily)